MAYQQKVIGSCLFSCLGQELLSLEEQKEIHTKKKGKISIQYICNFWFVWEIKILFFS
jgi:hypothetical protein